MSNIANQLIAVVATLSGFVAHDLLSQRSAPATLATVPTVSASLDTMTTRAISLDGLSVGDWLAASPRAERPALALPAATQARATDSGRPIPYETDIDFAQARVNDLRFDDLGRRVQPALLR